MLVTVFGGTGFVGRRVVRHLRHADFAVRVASRHPERGRTLFAGDGPGIDSVPADINDDESILTATRDAFAIVNAVSLYVEHGPDTFRSVHVDAAGRVAERARQCGVARLAHLSGIGSDPQSTSPYIRSRGEGEQAVRQAFPGATLIRPAVMFGPGDAFAAPLFEMLRVVPIFPLFGRGQTKLQPAYVDDVAEAIVRALRLPEAASIYELAGPQVYTYETLVRTIAAGAGKRPLLLPFPFPLWRAVGHACRILADPPITPSQVELMAIDNVAATGAPGFAALGISPRPLEEILPQIAAQAVSRKAAGNCARLDA
jgi:NADH dehydrogenase